MIRIPLFLFILLGWQSLIAQNPIVSSIDTTQVDLLFVRPKQPIVKYIPRGVRLTNPKVTLNRIEARTKRFKKFKMPSFWTINNELGINISEVAFVNWNAGGNNSITAITNLKFERNYKFRYLKWDNYMGLRYGINAQEGRKLRKTDDAIRLSSTFGYRRDTISNWYYSVKANFNTQFSDGYKYPNREQPISRFMAPGYSFLGAGTSYITVDQKFNLYISPLTQKATFVLDQDLANRGAFGVKKAKLDTDGNVLEPGENVYLELGFLITNSFKAQVMKNMGLKHRLSFYTDYLRDFGNVDVDWELNLDMKVNKYVAANIGTHIIYDDDILFDQVTEDGQITDPGEPRIQFKQLLGVGVSYNF
ncbi:MAG: DUF3078 domain-containing protein [Flavobacteriaceae bacterium]